MRKPKRFKKLLSFFLAFLMLMSSLTVGFTAFAAPSNWEAQVKALTNDAGNIGNYVYDVAIAWYNDGAKPSSSSTGHPASRATYKNLDTSGNGPVNKRGSWVVDNYADGRTYKAIVSMWHVVLEMTGRNDHLSNQAKWFFNGNLGPDKGEKKNLMGSDYPGTESEYAADGMIGALHDGVGQNKHHFVLIQLNDQYYLWNEYGNDLNNLTALRKTISSNHWKSRGFVWGGTNGAAEEMAQGYNYIDQYYEAIAVNADELKAFNNFFSSSADNQRDYWDYLVKGQNDEKQFDNIPRDKQIEIISQTATLLSNIQNASHSYNYDRYIGDDANTKTAMTAKSSDAAGREGTRKIFEHFFGCNYATVTTYVNNLLAYLLKQFRAAVNDVRTALYIDGDVSKGVRNDLTLSELESIQSDISFADGVYENLGALQSQVTTEKNLLDNTYKPDFVRQWNIANANAFIEQVEKLEKAYEGYPASFGQEGYVALVDTGLRPVWVKQTLDQAISYYNAFLANFNTKATPNNAPGIKDDATLNGNVTTQHNHYNYVLEKYNRYLYDDYLKAAHRLDAFWKKDSGSSYGSAYGGISARTDLNYFQIARAKSIITTVNNKYNALTDYYKSYGTNPGTSATPQNPPNYPPFYQNGVIPALNWYIQTQLPKDYQQYPIEAPTGMDWSNASSIASITDLMNRLSAFVSDAEMNKALLGVVLDKQSLDKNLFTKGEKLNTLVNDLCTTILTALGPILQKALFDTKLSGAAAAIVGADDALAAYRKGRIDGLTPDPNAYQKNSWFAGKWPEITQILNQAGYDWQAAIARKDEFDWHITSIDSLADALGGATCGAEIIVDAVLQNRQANVKALNIVDQKVTDGTPGYEKLVLPILEFLGCTNIRPINNFNDDKIEDCMRYIVTPLYNRVVQILESPDTLTIILDMLPSLAYALEEGIISDMLHSIDASLGGVGFNLFDTLKGIGLNSLDSVGVNELIQNLVSGIEGFSLPEISFLELGHLGRDLVQKSSLRPSGTRNWVQIDLKEKVLTWFVYYVNAVLQQNEDFIKDLALSGADLGVEGFNFGALLSDLLDNVFDYVKSDANFGADFFKLLTVYTPENFNWVQTVNGWKWVKNTVNYEEVKDLYTQAEVEDVISKLNEILNNILPGLLNKDKEASIKDFLNTNLYSSQRADELFNTFYRIFGADFLQKIYTIGTITINGTASPKINASPKALYRNLDRVPGVNAVREILEGVNTYYQYDSNNQPLYDDYGMRLHATYNLQYTDNTYVKDENGKNISMQYEGSFIVTKKVAVRSEDGKSYTLEDREVYNCFDLASYIGKPDPKDPENGKPSTKDDWNVNGHSDNLKRIVTALLYPFNDIATLLLAGETNKLIGGRESNVKLAGALYLKGNNGYEKALMPLFQALNFDNLMTADNFNTAYNNAMQNIIDMVFSYLNKLVEDPVGTIINAIPSIAYFIDNGGIQMLIANFLQPLANVITAITDIAKITQLSETSFTNNANKIGDFVLSDVIKKLFDVDSTTKLHWNNIQNELGTVISSIIPTIKLDKKDADGNKIQATDKDGKPAVDEAGNPIYEKEEFKLTIPEIPWGKIAGCGTGTVSGKAQVQNAIGADTLVTFVRFIWDDVVVASNKEVVEGILTNLLGKDVYALIASNIDIFGENGKTPLTGDSLIQLFVALVKVMDTSGFGETGTELQKIVATLATENPRPTSDRYEIKKSAIVYPYNPATTENADESKWQRYSEDNVKDFVQVLSNVVMSVLSNYTTFDLASLAEDGIYTSRLVASIAGAVYPLFDNATVRSVLEMIGVDINTLNQLSGIMIMNRYHEVADVVILSMTDQNAEANWNHDEKGNRTTYRYWILDEDGNPVLENGDYTYTYWEKNEDGSWKLDADGNHVIREKLFSDINWDYCVQQKLFKVYVEGDNAQSRDNLATAITAILTPFFPFVNFLLNAGSINIAGAAPLVGTNGYRNVIIPLLKLIGCNGIVSAEQYKTDAAADKGNLVKNIISPLLLKVDEVLRGSDSIGPVRAILDMIPDLANFVNLGGIQELIYELIYPFSTLLNTVLDVLTRGEITSIYDAAIDIVFYSGLIGGSEDDNRSTIQKIIEGIFGKKEADKITWSNVHNRIFTLAEKVIAMLKVNNVELKAVTEKTDGALVETALNVKIKGLNINGNTLDLELNIPKFDLGWVAGIGPGKYTDGDDYDAYNPAAVKKRTDSFLAIVQYIWKIVQVNKNVLAGDKGLLSTLLGDAYVTAAPFILSLLDEKVKVNIDDIKTDAKKAAVVDSANEIVAALIQFTESTDSSNHYADTSEGYDPAVDDIADLTWDKFFEYSDYTENDKYDIEYPKVAAKDLASGQPSDSRYEEDDVQTLVNALTTIIQKVLSEIMGTTVEGLVIEALYTNDIVAQVSKLICSLADNASVASIISQFGVDLTAKGFVKMLTRYGYVQLAAEIQKVIDTNGKLSDLQWFDTYQMQDGEPVLDKDGNKIIDKYGISRYWYVESGVADGNDPTNFITNVWDNSEYHNSKFEYNPDGSLKDTSVLNAGYRFTRALVVALSPFSGLINVLFNAGTGEYFGAIEITGTRGYRNAIKPLLDVLGCDTVTKEQYVEDANGKGTEGDPDYVAGNVDYVLYNIINPVISRVGDIMDDPINGALDIVTSLMAFIDNGGLQKAIEELLYPITQMFGPIIKLATRTVEGLEGSTDIFSIALSFIDLGDGVEWANIHTMLPTVIKSFLTIEVLDKKIDNKYVKILSKQVTEDQDKGKPKTVYYYISNEKIPMSDEDGNPVVDAEGNPVFETNEDGSFKYKEIEVAARNVDEIVGIEINGTIYKLDIDGININKHLKYLAYCLINANTAGGTTTFAAKADTAVTRRSDAFVALYRFIRDAIDANASGLIMPLVESALAPELYDAVGEYIENVIFTPKSKDGDNILITLIRVADTLDEALGFDVEQDAQDFWLKNLQITSTTATSVVYTAKTAKEDVARAIDTIYNTVNNAITNLVFKDNEDIDNLSDFAIENFLNNTLLSTIAKGVFSLADNETVSKIFNILNVSMNKAYIVQQLNKYGYHELATNIENYNGKLTDIPWFTEKEITDAEGNTVKVEVPSDNFGSKWYVSSKYDKDADFKQLFITNVWNTPGAYHNPNITLDDLDVTYRFARALVVVLSPFSKLIEVLTNDKLVDFSDDGSVRIQGSYGYTSAIKPLLDALGVDSIHRDKYRADAATNPDYAIYNVVYPLLDRVDEIMHRPVRELLNTLPTLANFINVGGIQHAVENLLVPVVSLLDPIVDLIMDEFNGDPSKVKSIYDVVIEIANTAFLNGALDGITWDDIHKNIATIVNAVIPTLYTTTYEGQLYTAKLVVDAETGDETYVISVQKKDEQGNDINEDVVIPKRDITKTENGILINGVVYKITIPDNATINKFLADIAGCQGVTEVDYKQSTTHPSGNPNGTGSLKPSLDAVKDIQPNVLVTLLTFVWDEVVQANFKDLIDPLLENVVDPLLEGTLKNGYTDVIRKYIVDDGGLFGEDSINYDGSEFIDLLVGVVNGLDSSDRHVYSDWTNILNKTAVAGVVEYPRIDTSSDTSTRYQSEDVKTLVSVITNIAMSAIEAFLDFTVIGIQEGNLYNSQFVVTLASAFYPVFDSAAVQSAFGILGVKDITLDNLAKVLRDAGYPRTADLVLAGYDENVTVDGVKVNYVERVKKQLNPETGKLEDVIGPDNEPVMESVYKYWATEEDGYTWKLLDKDDPDSHVMTYWIPEGDDYAKYTEEDEKADPSHVAGTYKIRDKQFSDINWTPCVEGKFFNIQTNPADGEKEWRENLVQAVSTILYPLNELLGFLFNGEELTIAGIASFKGSNGYENAIYPLLQVLGCSAERNDLVTPVEYAQMADTENGGSKYNLAFNILNPLFSRLNNILRGSTADNIEAVGPVRALLNLLPNLALFVEEGGIQKFVEELIYPVGNIVDTIVGVLSKDKSSLFDVVFDSFVVPDTLEPLHTSKGFEDTGITERIIEKLIVAVFNAPVKTTGPDDKPVMDDSVLQWNNANKHIFEIAAGFVKPNKDKSNIYLTVTADGQLEINNIKISIKAQVDENGNTIRDAIDVELPAIKVGKLNGADGLLGNLSNLGAPIPWANGPGNYDGMSAAAVQRRTDAFVLLWNYIWGVVENNDAAIDMLIDDLVAPLLGKDTFALVGSYITTVLGRSSEDVLSAFIAVTKALDTSSLDVSATWDAYFAQTNTLDRPEYPVKNYASATGSADELYTDSDVAKVVHTISGIAQSALAAATGNTLDKLSVDLLYNEKLVATIAQAICSLADNKIVAAFLPLLGIDFSLEAIKDKLTDYGYIEIATEVDKLISKTPGVQNGKLSDLVWFVQDTDKDGNPLVDEFGNKVMVPSELAKKWYVSDAAAFITNVWNNSTVKNPNLKPDGSDIDANYRFTRAIVVAVSPFSSIINTLINARTSTIFGEIQLTGSKGYRNAVKPLLEALGANPMSVNDFNAYIDGTVLDDGTNLAGKGNQDYVIYNILNPILSKVNDIISNPGDQLFATIASLGAFLSDEAFTGKGNLQSAVENLLAPVLKMVDPIVKLASDNDDLFTIVFNILGIYHHDKDGNNELLVTWNNIHAHLFDVVAHFLAYNEDKPDNIYATTLDKLLIINNININGKKYSLTVPEYDLSKLKNCTVESDTEKRAADAFITVFRYIRRILNVNSVLTENGVAVEDKEGNYTLDDDAFIPSLVKSLINNADLYAKLKPYLSNVLASKKDEILVTVIRLFENINSSALETDLDKIAQNWADLLKLDGTAADVDYNGLVVDEVTTAIKTLRDSVHNALDAYAPDIDIENFTENNLYKNNIPHMLASVIFPLGDSSVLAALLGILHIDVTRTGIINELERYGYKELANIIKAVPENEKLADIPWTIKSTDADGNEITIQNPDIAKLWYIENETDFVNNVWNQSAYQNPEVLNGNQPLNAQYRFTRSLVVTLHPFAELLGLLLQAKTIMIFDDPHDGVSGHDDVELKGEYGYSNAVKPLLEALGIDAMSGEEFRAMADESKGGNQDYIIYNIVNPILARADEILRYPVNSLLETLPTLAQYLGNGGLQESIKNLLYPFTKLLSPVIRLVLGEVRSANEVKPEKFYDLVIAAVANIADIELLKGKENLWSTVHEWEALTALIDGILDMVGVKTTVAEFKGNYVKVTPINADKPEEGYIYKYTVKEDGKDVEKTETFKASQTEKVLGVEINGIVYPITLPKEGPFDKIANCQILTADTQKAIDDAKAALEAAEATGDADAIAAAQKTLDDAKAAASAEVKANTLLALIQYICDVVEDNEPELITPLLKNVLGSNYDTFGEYINNVLGKAADTPGEVSSALVKLLNATDSSGYTATGWDIFDQIASTDVQYDIFSRDDVNNAIHTLSDIVTGVLENVLNTSITELTTEKIYTDQVVNTLARAIYTNVAGMESTLKLAGIDVSKENVVKLIGGAAPDGYGYADIADLIQNSAAPAEGQNWASTVSWTFDWQIDNKSENFAHAIAAVLSPFNALLSALLCEGSVNIAQVITITGANGYKNALKPLLEELGFDTTLVDENAPTIEAIIKVVLAKLDDIVKDDNLVGRVIDFLPGLANIIASGGVQKFIEELIYPVLNLINPVLALATDKNIFDFAIEILDKLDVVDLTAYGWDGVHNQIFTIISSFINVNYAVVDKKNVALTKDTDKESEHYGEYYYVTSVNNEDVRTYVKAKQMTGIAINGIAYPLHIPENIEGMNTVNIFATLAGCKVDRNTADEVSADTLVTAIRYIWEVVQANKDDLIKPLVKDLLKDNYDAVSQYINNILDETTADQFVEALIEILTNLGKLNCNVDWSFLYNGYTSKPVDYPLTGKNNAKATAKDIADVISTLSDAVNGVIPMLLKDGNNSYSSLSEFVSDKLYTDDIVNALAKVLIPLCENETVVNILSIIGVDYSIDAIVDIIISFGDATNLPEEISKVDSFAQIDWNNVTWGVNSKETFVAALSKLLSPFAPVLDFVLNGKDLVIANGALSIPGHMGYANAIKPVLEVFGCDTVAIDNANASIEDILTVLLNRVDVILNAPVDEATALIAPLMNFINKGGIQKVVEELLHPITNIINPVVRLAADRDKDGNLTDANIFEIAFDIVKNLDAVKDIIPAKAEWNTVQNYIFTIVGSLINVNYAVVDRKNVALTKNNDENDKNYGKFYYITTDAAQKEVKKYVADKNVKQMAGIAVNGIAYPLTIPSEVLGVNIFEALASCGTLNTGDNTISGNGSDTFVTLMRYIWTVVEANKKELILPLLKELLKAEDKNGIYAKVGSYIETLLNDKADDVIVALANAVQGLKTDADRKDAWAAIRASVEKTNVEYPAGVLTQAEVTEFLDQISSIVNAVLPSVLPGLIEGKNYKSLNELVAGELYTKSLVETIAKALRGIAVDENGNVKAINETLKTVAGIDLTKVPTKIGTVNSKETFVAELVKVLAPLNPVINALLKGDTLNIAGAVDFGGENGYVYAIKPLLQVLGCKNLETTVKDNDPELAGILTAVLNRVDEILADPITEVLEMLPQLANFIDKGGIQIFVEEIIYPVIRVAEPIVALVKDKDQKLFDFVLEVVSKFVPQISDYLPKGTTWSNIHTKIIDIVKNVLPESIEINGVKYKLNIPNLVLAELAGCGTGTGLDFNPNKADAFVTLFGYIWKVVKANEKNLIRPLLNNLIGDNETVAKIIDRVLKLDTQDALAAIVHLLDGFKADGHKADWSKIEAAIKTTKVKYPNGVTAKDMDVVIDTVSAVLDGVLPMVLKSTGYDSLQALVAGMLYTPDLINTIAGALKGLAENKQVTDILAYVGITLKASDYNKKWNVNDADSFAKALAELVKPFNGVIDALLNGGSITVAANLLGDEAIVIEGENGYVNAVKPLLTVLGCDTSKIVDGKATVEAIVKSLLDRVDEILANPVEEVVALIPQLVNFINNGGIQTFVEELIYPVTRIVAPIAKFALGDDKNLFDVVFDIVKDIDAVKKFIPAKATWDTIQNYIFDIISKIDINIPINGKNYSLNIPALDLKALGGCGTGNGFDYNANKADAIIIVLRYVWNVVQSNKTEFLLPMLKELLGGNYEKFGQYIETLLGHKDDEVIKAIVDLFKNLDASGHKADWSFLYKDYKAANLKYPNGVTSKDLEQVVQILTVAVNNALQIFLNKTLDDLVPELIYTDSIINTLANAIGSLKNNKDLAQVFALLGVDFSKVNYAQKWNVTDKRSFANALATILSPFNNVLAVLLNSGTLNIEGIIEFTGADGYENAIKPLLDVLGVSTVSAAQYKADAIKNSNNLLLNILNPLLDRVDEILANPIEELLDLLPAIANFMDKGGLQYFVEELIYPLTNLVSPIVKLVTKDSIFEFVFKLLRTLGVLDINISWKNIQNEIIPLVNTFLTNISINGKSYSITVPNIDWSVLGGCGKLSSNAIDANQGDVLMTLLRYIFKVLDANKGMLFDLVGGKDSTIGQIINNVLKQGADGMAKIVVTILLKLEAFDNVQWTFKNIKKVTVEYTEHLGKEEYFEAIGLLDETISSLLGQFLNISLQSVLGDLVYTNSIINTLAKLIYTNIENVNIGIDLNTVLKVVDLDVSTSGVSSILKDYGAASREIGRHAKWSEVNFDSLNWGFKDGDRNGFVNALSAILRPVQPILRVILSGEDLIVLGSIKIKGGNGYNTAIIPLLEALGVNPGSLVSPQQYAKEASTDKVLTNILNPLLDKVEELTRGPIDALTKMLPNIAYFVYNGGVKDIAENLIAPVTNILHEIDPIYSLNLDLSMLDNVDLAGLVNGILAGIKISGQPLGIVLPDIDLAVLAGLGDIVNYRSARTYFGKQMDCKKINADQAAVFITVLRYLIKTIQNNLDNISKLLAGLGLSGDVADMIKTVLEMLTTLDVDGVIEGLMNLLFNFDISDDNDANESDKNAKGKINLGDLSLLFKVYWVIFAIIVLILAYFLFLLFKKNDDEENPENPEGPNPPEDPSEEQETNKENNEQGDKI